MAIPSNEQSKIAASMNYTISYILNVAGLTPGGDVHREPDIDCKRGPISATPKGFYLIKTDCG